jgi:uncharacterized membrane protein
MSGGTMTGIDYFAWFVLIVIVVSVVWVFVALAKLPGQIAAKNKHPHADAINAAGWLGMLLSLGVFWLSVIWALAVVWSRMKPVESGESDADDAARLRARIAELEAKLEAEAEAVS